LVAEQLRVRQVICGPLEAGERVEVSAGVGDAVDLLGAASHRVACVGCALVSIEAIIVVWGVDAALSFAGVHGALHSIIAVEGGLSSFAVTVYAVVL